MPLVSVLCLTMAVVTTAAAGSRPDGRTVVGRRETGDRRGRAAVTGVFAG